MDKNIEINKSSAEKWFRALRDKICNEFQELEISFSNKNSLNPSRFHRKSWKRPGGGGGVISLMRGNLFEKVGVNISTVHGVLPIDFRASIPGAEKNGKFWASGISLVSHPLNPYIPSAHLNTRLIHTSKTWFGGGGDITPMLPSILISNNFHNAFKKTCDKHDPNYYDKFKLWADEYFFIKHRGEARGDGGIFFDNLNTDNWENDFSFVKDVGKTFLEIYSTIISQTMNKKWSKKDREKQLLKRGRYVEFNLVYDRGTLFGLKTDGNIEAILMSLPPEVKWL
tara:strand:+ start:764 stop:1612 length:849 start_codon:yes stop_codon:yes gene_type:complete